MSLIYDDTGYRQGFAAFTLTGYSIGHSDDYTICCETFLISLGHKKLFIFKNVSQDCVSVYKNVNIRARAIPKS